MKAITKPQPNQPAIPFLTDTGMWSLLFDMLAAYRNGEFQREPKKTGAQMALVGKSATTINEGVIKQISTMENPVAQTEASVLRMLRNQPIFNLQDPVWHTAIDNIVVVNKTIVKDTAVPINNPRFVALDMTIDNAGHRYAMIDPSTPTALKSGTGGIFRIYGSYSDGVTILDTQQSQPLWRYELTQDSQAPSATTAKLLNLDGTEFASSINLSDPLSIGSADTTGYEGYCVHVGNEFHIAPGPCP